MKTCFHCGKEIPSYLNYCESNGFGEGDCMLKQAKEAGLPVIAPNGLPIRCITATAMLEHEHADHPDYKFPIDVAWENVVVKDKFDYEYTREFHAVIYRDDAVVLTLYECCYHVFYLRDGTEKVNFSKNNNPYRKIAEESLLKLRQCLK